MDARMGPGNHPGEITFWGRMGGKGQVRSQFGTLGRNLVAKNTEKPKGRFRSIRACVAAAARVEVVGLPWLSREGQVQKTAQVSFCLNSSFS